MLEPVQSLFFRHFRTFSVRISEKLVEVPPVPLRIFRKFYLEKSSEMIGKRDSAQALKKDIHITYGYPYLSRNWCFWES